MAEVRWVVTVKTGSAHGHGVLRPGGQEPPGHVSPADLRVLSPQECLSLLEPGGVGRVGFTSGEGIVILPVNFAVKGNAIVFRTAPDTLLAAHGNGPTSEHEVQRLENATSLEPWASGARDVYVRIAPTRISGRRIGADESPPPGAQR
jgi:hypothetical protein